MSLDPFLSDGFISLGIFKFLLLLLLVVVVVVEVVVVYNVIIIKVFTDLGLHKKNPTKSISGNRSNN